MASLPGGRSGRPTPREEAFAVREPYFTVLASPDYLRANLTPERQREFFDGGETLVDAMFRTIEIRLAPHFAPTAILEYGCGAGRLALPLARRAARRNGTVTAVDVSVPMLELARQEAARQSLHNLSFQSATDFFDADSSFDFVSCYFVFQRMRPSAGLALLGRLLGRIRSGGVGAFQFPYRVTVPRLVQASRWARNAVPGVNALANAVRGRSPGEPLMACYTYRLDAVLGVIRDASLDAAHIVFEPHAGLDSAIVYVEAPMRLAARKGEHRAAPAAAEPILAPAHPDGSRPVDVRALTGQVSIAELNRAAEDYFATITDREYHLAKPFGNVDETPQLLIDVATMVQGLRLRPGAVVLEFGAGTGWLSRFLTQLGCRVILLDVSATALAMARELYDRVPVLGDRPAPEFLLYDGRTINLADISVDRIVSLHAFHHAPNPDRVVAEFGRILRPGGIAGFAEPGPDHSRSAQSQFEMRTYRVVENDVDVHAVWRTARACGFAEVKLAVFNGLPFHVSIDQYEDLLAGGATGAAFVSSTRVFLRNVRSFFLFKEGAEAIDSHAAGGLACQLHLSGDQARGIEGQPLEIDVRVTNVGAARWLASDEVHGGVALGAHLYDEAGRLLDFGAWRGNLTEPPRPIPPGESLTCRVVLAPLRAGRYLIEFDCVSSQVMWFAQLGSRPARVRLDIVSQQA